MATLTGNESLNYLYGQPSGTPLKPSANSFESTSGHVSSAGGTVSTAQVDASASTTLANITGLSNTIIKPGTYRFSAYLPGTANAAGGVKYAFSYSGMTLTSIAATGKALTASAIATAFTTVTATGTSLVSSTSAAIFSELQGTFVVASVNATTGGTIRLQFAQSAATAATSSVYAGAYMQIARVS